jgi:hypothetical protein
MTDDRRKMLEDLRDRLAKASGPDRELDDELHSLAGYDYETHCPAYTASLDAAVMLVPGAGYYKLFVSKTKNATVTIPVPPNKWWEDFSAETAPLALCLARIEHELAEERT